MKGVIYMTKNEKTTIGILVSLILCAAICISYQFGRYVQCRIDINAIPELQEYYMDRLER